MSTNFIAPHLPRHILGDFFTQASAHGCDVRNVSVYQGGECLVRWAPAPYGCDVKSEVYSISKSFTSTAIGLAVGEGLVSVDEAVVDIFAHECPDTISDNLKQLRVHHLLSMNTGHDVDTMPVVRNSQNGVRDFLALPVIHTPGTHFLYNTGASYMLSAIISLRTGRSALDYLACKLFGKLGITGVQWSHCGGAVCQGGTGITISNDDIAKLALLYLNKGMWNGEQLLPASWVEQATTWHSDTSASISPDWKCGYGYQFWNNARGGFRGDGACGQLCLVFPQHDMVCAIQAETDAIQDEMDVVVAFTDALAACANSATPCADAASTDTSADDILSTYPTLDVTTHAVPFVDTCYRCTENPFGFTWLRLHEERDGLLLELGSGDGTQCLYAGKGTWRESNLCVPFLKPKLALIMQTDYADPLHTAACYNVAPVGENGALGIDILCRHLNTPHRETIEIRAIEGGIQLSFACRFELLDASAKTLTAFA